MEYDKIVELYKKELKKFPLKYRLTICEECDFHFKILSDHMRNHYCGKYYCDWKDGMDIHYLEATKDLSV